MTEPVQEPSITGERALEDANGNITNEQERWLATQRRGPAIVVLDDAIAEPSWGNPDTFCHKPSPTPPPPPRHGTDADDTKRKAEISSASAIKSPWYAQKPDALAVLGNVVKALSADEAYSSALSYNSNKGALSREELRSQVRTFLKRTEEILSTSLSEQTASFEDDARRLAQLLKEMNSFLQLPEESSTLFRDQEDRDFDQHQTFLPARVLSDINKIITRLTDAQDRKKVLSHDDEGDGKHLLVLCLGEI
jgi:hypothetical protein